MDYPQPVQTLIQQLARLPGLGKRSAERIALHLLRAEPGLSQQLARAIQEAKSRIRNCSRCGGYTEQDPCPWCCSPRRDPALLCVVEGPNDILTLEKAGAFNGIYHALMGRISPLNAVGPDQLRIAALIERVKTEKPREIIIALGADVESDATASYLIEQLKPLGVSLTRIARGLPAGAALESADEVTLARALEGRQQV
jgi:recombination protein RecR